MNSLVFLWLVVALLFLITEMGSPGLFFFLSFSCGAFICAFLSLWTVSPIVQGCVFLGVTGMAFFVLRIFFHTFDVAKGGKTNVYALCGKHGYVTQCIVPDDAGYVRVEGALWMARSLHHKKIEVGTNVIVVDICGAHLVVEAVTDSKHS